MSCTLAALIHPTIADDRGKQPPDGITGEYKGGPWFYGDVDGNGDVNLFDLLCLLDGLRGLFTCPGVTFEDLDIHPCDFVKAPEM